MKLICAMVMAAGLAVVGCNDKKNAEFKESAKKTGEALKDTAEQGAAAVKETGERAGEAIKKGYESAKEEFNKDKPAAPKSPDAAAPAPAAGGPLDLTMNQIDGSPKPLSDYRGKVVMFVNVASKCGYTPQYAGLQKLYRDKSDKGFVILGFPANNFKGQEPGTDAEIAQFCTDNYAVSFPMFSKISVVGDDQHELYKRLSAQGGGDPKWNFTKYLVDRKGNEIAKYDSKVTPDDPTLVAKIDELLASK